MDHQRVEAKPVLDEYHRQRALVRSQLEAMFRNHQQKIALPIAFISFMKNVLRIR